MTKYMFSEWLDALKMRAQKRNILLLLDNCSAHPDIELSNIKLVFLPLRTTSHLQPCDAGIIQAVKLQYRKLYEMENIGSRPILPIIAHQSPYLSILPSGPGNINITRVFANPDSNRVKIHKQVVTETLYP